MGQSFLLDCSRDLRRIMGVIALVVVCGHYTEAAESAHAANLRRVLDRQDAWLSSSSQGDGWRSFLHNDALREELAKSTKDVDRRKVAKILARYKSDTPGLESPRFVATQKAITNWANECRVALVIRWAEEVRESAKNAERSGDAVVEASRRELVDATDNLKSILSTADTATREGWKSFLKWDDLDESLAADAPDWKSLQGVGGQFFNGHPGLEFPEFVRVRNALRKYIYLGSQNSKASLEAQLNELANTMDRYNKKPTTKHAGDVASLLDWMQQIDEVPGLASKVRAVHNLPNLKVRISEGFLQRRFSQDVHEPMAVNEWILGTQVRGNAITTGKISADLVKNANVAQIDIVFHGTANTRSIGRQKPVTIHSTSQARLVARKPLFIFPQRIAAARTKATAWTKTTIQSIIPDRKMGRRLVEKIARKRAAEQKAKAEAIASAKTARRLEQSIEEQSAELLGRAKTAMQRQMEGPISRRGLLPEELKTLTLDSCLIVFGHQANAGQYGARTKPPEFCPQDDVVAQVHESAFNNTAEKAIAGLTLTDERIAELTKEATGSVPEELQITEEKTPWSLSFAWNQPVTVEFDDEQFRISIRARRLTSGDRTLEFGRRGTAKYMEISAKYAMKVNATGVHLTRQGDVEVLFAGRERLGVKERVFKTLMEKKFEEVFKTEIQGEGFQLPGQFADLGTIRLQDLSAENGWLSVGWK